MKYIRQLWSLKPLIATALAFLLPISLVTSYPPELASQSKCAYVIVVMALLWLTEAIPIPVTALLPVCLFPLLRVATASDISGVYVKDTTMLFLGGLIIAVALEETHLHTRISLCVMIVVGAQPVFLTAGLMATTWFLSMWISNTAAASMMIPIIEAVMENLEAVKAGTLFQDGISRNDVSEETSLDTIDLRNIEHGVVSHPDTKPPNTESKQMQQDNKNFTENILILDNDSVGMNDSRLKVNPSTKGNVNDETTGVNEPDDDLANSDSQVTEDSADTDNYVTVTKDNELQRIAKAFALSVAYGASIGGLATLTGTPPNIVLKQQADKLFGVYSGTESDISFTKWMGFALPMSLLMAILGWLWLALVFLRCRCFGIASPEERKAIDVSIRQQFKKLGRLSFREVEVLAVFIIQVILWLFRAPPNIGGWGKSNALEGFVSDSTPCILLSVILFLLPARLPNVFCLTNGGKPTYTPILQWNTVTTKLPWGVTVLLGGGFAIAKASEDSGLSEWLGNKLSVFESMDNWVMNLIICLIIAGATEVTSNTTLATLLIPILAQLAMQTNIHPLYLMISANVASSFAFMLPVATPPNAIVFSTGYLTIPDMALAGLPMKFISIVCLTLAINTWGTSLFDLATFPEIFKTNASIPVL